MTIIEFSKLQANFTPVILVAGLIAGLVYFKSLNSLHKALMAYLALMFLTDLLSGYIGRKYGNNHIVLHIYSLTELAFMIYFYQKHMFRKMHPPLLILGILGLIYISGEILLYYVFKPVTVQDFQPYAKVVDNFVIILMALAYMQERMNHFREIEWGNFRLNMAFLVFFTLTALFFLPFNFLVNAHSDVKFYFWAGHGTLLVLLYLYLSLKMINPAYKRV